MFFIYHVALHNHLFKRLGDFMIVRPSGIVVEEIISFNLSRDLIKSF